MPTWHKKRRGAVIASAGVAVVLLSACGGQAQFVVTQMPMVDLTQFSDGHRVELGEFRASVGGSYASNFVSLVRQEVQNNGAEALALDKDLEIVPSGGGLRLTATASVFDLQSDEEREESTCRITVNNEARTVACTRVTKTVEIQSTTNFEVRDRSGTLVYSGAIERGARDSNSGTVSSYDRANNPPDDVDVSGLVVDLAQAVGDAGARFVFAWEQTVRERFSSCNGDERCRTAVELAQSGRLVEADELLTDAIGGRESTTSISSADAGDVANLLRNRAIVRRYSSDFAGAEQDMLKAIELEPDNMSWRDELDGIRIQSVGGTPTDAREVGPGIRGFFDTLN